MERKGGSRLVKDGVDAAAARALSATAAPLFLAGGRTGVADLERCTARQVETTQSATAVWGVCGAAQFAAGRSLNGIHHPAAGIPASIPSQQRSPFQAGERDAGAAAPGTLPPPHLEQTLLELDGPRHRHLLPNMLRLASAHRCEHQLR